MEALQARRALLSLLVLAAALASIAPSFTVRKLPIRDSGASAFIAHGDADSVADVFVLEGNSLTLYPSGAGRPPYTLVLPAGTSAIDVADIDGDGQNDLVAVTDGQIRRYALAASENQGTPELLLLIETRFADPEAAPYPCVLVVPYEGSLVLALPVDNALELWDFQGERVAIFPIAPETLEDTAYRSPFAAWGIDPPRAGPPGSLEFRITSTISATPQLPGQLLPGAAPGLPFRPGTPTQARDAASLRAVAWPWFPLRSRGRQDERILYSLAGPDFTDTIIRIRRPEDRRSRLGKDAFYISPKRRYPGVIIAPRDQLPDFNADGFTDLLLWKAPRPGASIDSLTMAMHGGTWPVQLTTHLFSPDRGLYEARPAGHIQCRVPVHWFISKEHGAPLRNLVQSDFDGDGRMDIGFTTDSKTFALWLWRGKFTKDPDFTASFSEVLEGVEMVVDLEGQGRTTVILRSSKAFYLLSLPKEG